MKLKRLAPEHLFLGLLSVAFVALGAYWTSRAPGGAWVNRLFDVYMWWENDPGGWYIPAAHGLVSKGDRGCFFGHPGTPLTMVLYAEQVGLYGIGRLVGSAAGFTPFIVQHMETVWAVAKVSMAALHAASFLVLYRFSLLLLGRRDLALWSVALYATSFPLLYYLNRVSVEPLVILFFLGTAVCLARAAGPETARGAALWGILAGVSATSAFCAKVHLMGPWPFVGLAAAVAGRRGRGPRLAAYVLGAAASLAFYTRFIDWGRFFHAWGGRVATRTGGATEPVSSAAAFGSQVLLRVLGRIAESIERTQLVDWLPACTRSNCFFLFELLFVAAGLAGLGVILARRVRLRAPIAAAVAQCAFVAAIWLYRSAGKDFNGFHYLFPAMAVLAPLAAAGLSAIAPGLSDPTRPTSRRFLEMALLTLALHHAGVFAAFDSKRQDREGYVRSGAAAQFAALARAGSGRIVVLGRALSPFDGTASFGISDSYAAPDQRCALVAASEDVLLVEPRKPGPGFAEKARAQGVAVVLDYSMAEPGPWTLEEWAARSHER
jgi:hypothetical protein